MLTYSVSKRSSKATPQIESTVLIEGIARDGGSRMNATSPATRDECIANDIALRNQLVTTMLDEVRPMVWNFVRKYRVDFDDAYQHSAWLMLDVWHKMPEDVINVKGYLNATVKRGLYHLLRSNINSDNDALSLEMPYDEDGTMLADTLEAPAISTEAELDYLDKVQSDYANKVTEVVHAVLRECRTEEQKYAKETYGLVNYTLVVNEKLAYRSRQVKQERHVRSIRRSVQNVFRKHPQVLSLIQREICIL